MTHLIEHGRMLAGGFDLLDFLFSRFVMELESVRHFHHLMDALNPPQYQSSPTATTIASKNHSLSAHSIQALNTHIKKNPTRFPIDVHLSCSWPPTTQEPAPQHIPLQTQEPAPQHIPLQAAVPTRESLLSAQHITLPPPHTVQSPTR